MNITMEVREQFNINTTNDAMWGIVNDMLELEYQVQEMNAANIWTTSNATVTRRYFWSLVFFL